MCSACRCAWGMGGGTAAAAALWGVCAGAPFTGPSKSPVAARSTAAHLFSVFALLCSGVWWTLSGSWGWHPLCS